MSEPHPTQTTRARQELDDLADELAGADPDPNRPVMRNWVVVPGDHAARWPELAYAAHRHVAQQ